MHLTVDTARKLNPFGVMSPKHCITLSMIKLKSFCNFLFKEFFESAVYEWEKLTAPGLSQSVMLLKSRDIRQLFCKCNFEGFNSMIK